MKEEDNRASKRRSSYSSPLICGCKVLLPLFGLVISASTSTLFLSEANSDWHFASDLNLNQTNRNTKNKIKSFNILIDHSGIPKRLSLGSILDPAPVILRYDLIIGTDDNMGEWFLFRMHVGQWRYIQKCVTTLCQYITPNSYICYGHNER
ncbi:hypothetical protein H8356DRAFT_1423271 [Neocallimastix lanati (nom. inval.)]|nr:hypothetical protein H8356DRAFT_1423271 [Neocallimastix sp. JGI-2020a]